MKHDTLVDLWAAFFALGVGLMGAFLGATSVVICVIAFLLLRWTMRCK